MIAVIYRDDLKVHYEFDRFRSFHFRNTGLKHTFYEIEYFLMDEDNQLRLVDLIKNEKTLKNYVFGKLENPTELTKMRFYE